MKMLDRVEHKFLWLPIELYRYDPDRLDCDAKHEFWLRTVGEIYRNDTLIGYSIDGRFWVDFERRSVLLRPRYRERSISKYNRLHELAATLWKVRNFDSINEKLENEE